MKKIAVLLSSYNGEKYIIDQLNGIVEQEEVDIKLIIRDDGSRDRTREIISSFQEVNDNVLIIDDYENIGVGKSFFKLLRYAFSMTEEFDFFAFADQDDVWLKDKLKSAVIKINATREPCLYCSNQELLINGESKGNRFFNIPDNTFKGNLLKNPVSGCTFVFNKGLAKKILGIPEPPRQIIELRLHDGWIKVLALIFGKVIYDPIPHMLYRIHDNNVVGLRAVRRDKNWIKRTFHGERKGLLSEQASFLLKHCYDDVDDEKKETLLKIKNYKNSFRDKTKLIRDKDFSICSGTSYFIFVIKAIIGFL